MERILKQVVKTDLFDPEILRRIETMPHSEALTQCRTLIEGTKTKPAKKTALLRDIEKAPDSRELSRIMWNVMLSGEGLAITDSRWQALYGN